MKNFIVLTILSGKGQEVSNPDFCSFEHYADAVNYFYYLVGSHSSYLSECSCRVFSPENFPCLHAMCVSNGSTSYFIYLQKKS